MKYMVLLCDGMADKNNAAFLGGKTPMEAAYKPHMDALAKTAEIGLCKTVAEGLKPGSDVANLSVMGYDPMVCYSGRSPLEAASIGVDLKPTDVALRCNLVTLSDAADYTQKTMVDYCAGDISTAEAAELIAAVQEKFGSEKFAFYAGVSYRHCLVVANGTTELGSLTPPHDITGKPITEYLSTHANAALLIEMMKESYDFLMAHPVNKARMAKGLRPANSIWLWGEGRKPKLENFFELHGKTAGVVSAVDLIKGIGICAGMKTVDVEGATGYIDTNFEGKAAAAKELFDAGCDMVYIHVEAPDECGHRGEAENKQKAIEEIDARILSDMLVYLKAQGDYRILIMPDHPTPLETMTHCADAVPYLLFDSRKNLGGGTFTEKGAAAAGNYITFGPSVMNRLLEE
ncbi:MAG: cofactor-independent phosphoglycerate mutase [Clostridia bacterium]|nr:cofactor-independent phosphoglycerate mutase [Clostridia bacterium]